MDRRPFSKIEGERELPERKAHTIRGSMKSWPVGITPAAGMPNADVIIVTEGGPDLLACYDLCHLLGRRDCRPVTILGRGAGCRIHPDALREFAGKRVRIIPHIDDDDGGIEAAMKWGLQIATTGADVDFIDLKKVLGAAHPNVTDLNDLVVLCRDRIENLAGLLP